MASLEFKDLTYSVPIGDKKCGDYKTILQGVTGMINPGEMVAIIGSSGAGKTTLLNILAGRTKTGKLSGEILFNGAKRVRKTFKKDVAYVEQDDLMFPDLTVRETLNYAASFRLNSREYTAADKKARVEELLKSLRLKKSEKTLIGNASIKGVSGGERKRVSIAVEIMADPKMVMLDEPTSGLDSNSSEMVMRLVKDISVERRIISMASIHQPNFKTFSLFDKLILLAPGGLVYFGPTLKALDYFESIGYKCEPHENPSDFFIDIMTIKTESEKEFEESAKDVEILKQKWAEYTQQNGYIYDDNSSVNAEVKGGKLEKGSTANTIAEIPEEDPEPSWSSSWFMEYVVLLQRSWKRQLRDPQVLMSYFINSVITMLLVGFIFFRRADGVVAAQNKIGVTFLTIVNIVYPAIIPILPVLIAEKLVMNRERSSGSYRMSSFFASIYFTKVPISIVSNLILLTGTYFLAKFQYDATKFFIYLAIYLSALLCSLGFAFAVSCSTDSVETASIMATLILSIYTIFGGVLVNADSVTKVLSWMKYTNYLYYTYVAAMQNEMDGLVFNCEAGANAACYPNGQAVVDAYSLSTFLILECILINLGMAVGYVLIAYLFLRFKSKPRFVWL